MNLRILFVEDMPDDAELMLRRLREGGIEPHWARVDTAAALREVLADEQWQVALVDFNLPSFSGPEAIGMLAELAPDVPAITVSGAISEETAVATITAGAVDYVLKDNLTRLAPAVLRAAEGAELRCKERQAAEAARLALFAVDHASMSIMTVASDGTIIYVNDFACAEYEGRREDMVGAKLWDYDGHASASTWAAQWDALKRSPVADFEAERVRADGSRRVRAVTTNFLEGADCLVSYARDITESKQAEDALRESEERFEQFAAHFPGYLFMQDEERRYVYVNRQDEKDGDVPREAWFGKTPSQVWEGEDAVLEEDRVQRALDGEVVDAVVSWMPPGLHEYVHSIYFLIPRAGKPSLVGGFSLDVTEQVEAQEEILRNAEQLRRTVEGAVLAMSHVVETRDPYTAGHERRVSELATAMAAELGMAGEALTALRLAGLIHDIGKVAVPAEILSKPGRLSAVEFDLIKQHAQTGFDILAPIDFGAPVAEMVLQHHERLDGSGYPRGLAGEAILPEARILAVADVVEAMSSHRPYRAALGMEAALAEIRAQAGVKYDAEVAGACLRVIEEQGFQFSV